MKYSIITPTYKRPDKLIRCVESILSQKRNMENGEEVSSFDFELIVVNDSPVYDYSFFENYLNKIKEENLKLFAKIKYFINEKNMGVNYSRNYALDYVSKDVTSDYIIFLDDDDWLSCNALETANKVIKNNLNQKWYVSNLAKEDNTSFTKNKTNKNIINYFYNYLLLKNFSGDVTHTIKSEIATQFRFSNKIKNGEEWTYFIQIPHNFFYYDNNSKFTNGYSTEGVNISMQKSYGSNTKILWGEINSFKMFIMLMLREVKVLVHKFI